MRLGMLAPFDVGTCWSSLTGLLVFPRARLEIECSAKGKGKTNRDSFRQAEFVRDGILYCVLAYQRLPFSPSALDVVR